MAPVNEVMEKCEDAFTVDAWGFFKHQLVEVVVQEDVEGRHLQFVLYDGFTQGLVQQPVGEPGIEL